MRKHTMFAPVRKEKDEKLEYDKIRDFLGIQTEYDKQTHVAARTKDWGDV